MIEVEKKVILSNEKLNSFLKKAIFLKEIKILDSYFDNENYKYTLDNTWIRKRDDNFEIKVGIKKNNESFNEYQELTKKNEIYEFLEMENDISIEDFLKKNKIFNFLTFETVRKKYKLDEFIIDVDIARYKDKEYKVLEVELLVQNNNEIENARNKIAKLLDSFNINQNEIILGKLIFFLKNYSFEHFKLLKDKKVILA
jgi:adenylate cyclase class IV